VPEIPIKPLDEVEPGQTAVGGGSRLPGRFPIRTLRWGRSVVRPGSWDGTSVRDLRGGYAGTAWLFSLARERAMSLRFSFTKEQRRVTVFYVYVWDEDFGPAFIKICSYFPYPIKVWVNGHEWAKRQATKAGIAFTELSNGFATCDDPAALQVICDRLGPGTIRVFFERWTSRLPLPLTSVDRDAGFWWDLTMRQVETSRTIVFQAPRHARSFFEALVADNLDLGRPESVEIIFGRHRGRRAGGVFKTAIDQHTHGVTINVFYKHSRIKQYLKDGRALRIETVINDAYDIGCQRLLPNLDMLQAKARAINQQLLDTERVGQGTVLASPAFERIAQSTVTDEGRRAPALRFGDPRVQALAGALANTLFAVADITNKSLRAVMTGLLGTPYSMNQASYDLTRLRHNGLIVRVPDHHRYTLTPEGIQFAIFYTKVHDRVLKPLLATHSQPHAPPELRAALRNHRPDSRPAPRPRPATHGSLTPHPTHFQKGSPHRQELMPIVGTALPKDR
jgi:hypothetical protein